MTERTSGYLAAVIFMYSIGCGVNQESPRSRLEVEFPVRAEMLIATNCQIDGQDVDERLPVRAQRGKPLMLTGQLASGEWKTKSVMGGWAYDRTVLPNIPKTEPRIELNVLLHGNDVSNNFGVLPGILVESRPLKRPDESKLEFRAKITPPKYPGRYVMDLHAIDVHNLPEEVINLEKMGGAAIWRRELWVE